MTTQATATFEVKIWDEKPYNEIDAGPKLARASVTKSYQGDIQGEGTLEYLMMRNLSTTLRHPVPEITEQRRCRSPRG